MQRRHSEAREHCVHRCEGVRQQRAGDAVILRRQRTELAHDTAVAAEQKTDDPVAVLGNQGGLRQACSEPLQQRAAVGTEDGAVEGDHVRPVARLESADGGGTGFDRRSPRRAADQPLQGPAIHEAEAEIDRASCRRGVEDGHEVSRQQFEAFLEQKTAQLRKQKGSSAVEFVVSVEGGKARLKARVTS